MEPKDFQSDSAQRIVELFNGGQNRVLLADEVGLGKTIVARAVVEKMREQAQKQGKKLKVIYVCSNQGIIQQNAHRLGIEKENVVKLSESRLSMQHKVLYGKQDKEYLIPITPATSLVQTNGYGNANERALIFSLIRHRFEKSEQKCLKRYLDVYRPKGGRTAEFQQNRIKEKEIEIQHLDGYCGFIKETLDGNVRFAEIIDELKQEFALQDPDKKYINQLRTLFSEISMDLLHPDLVIMDEFQRYRDLMKGGVPTEENRLAQRLFSNKKTKILLVSATPYRPMVTLEEISQTGRNEQFEDFIHLMEFLMDKNYGAFETKWKRYSELLGSLSLDTVDALVKAKEEAEAELRKVMVRTERYVPNLTLFTERDIHPSSEEVKEYQSLREVLSKSAELKGQKSPSLNIDYVKSGSYLLSFMQQYVEKEFIERVYKGRPGPKHLEGLLVKNERIKKRKSLGCSNARLKELCEMLMLFQPQNSVANLLWVPASIPYYKPTGIFETCSDFSKILVFSQWGFVPRMLATVLSYEAGRSFIKKNNSKSKSNALDDYKELLLAPYPNLAKLYEKGDRCEDLKDVQSRIKEALKPKLKLSDKSVGYKHLLMVLDRLNDEWDTVSNIQVDRKTLDLIVNIIIASPGVCLFRCFKKDYLDAYKKRENGLFKFASAFVNMLGNDESHGVIVKNIKKGRVFERTIAYCVMGNLQAVFDEYKFALGYDVTMSDKDKKALWEKMESSIMNRSPLEIDTDVSFCSSQVKKASIRRWFACDYAKLKADDKDEKHKISVQSAFNSPFRPFVLATTSVGQEGLDFHLYCRRIVHWNLPSNPVDLEQRSGRIDRYECLAIRRSVAHLFDTPLDWQEVFKNAHNEWHKAYANYNDMVPYWCLPKEVIKSHDGKIEPIENIFLLYPMSRDKEQYRKLTKQLSLYRLTMGQPDQEFVIELLEKLGLEEDNEIKDKLMFHLSPNQKKHVKRNNP